MTVEPQSAEVPAPSSVPAASSAPVAFVAPAASSEAVGDASPSHPPVAPTVPTAPTAPGPAVSTHLPWYRWVLESLRAAVFMAPRTGAAAPTPAQLISAMVVSWGLVVLGEWWAAVAVGPVEFNAQAWLGQHWLSLALLGAAWWAMWPVQKQAPGPAGALAGGVPAWLLLSSLAVLPWVIPLLLIPASDEASAGMPAWQDRLDWTLPELLLGLSAIAVILCSYAAMVRLTARFVRSRWRTAVFALCLVAGTAVQLGVGVEPTWKPVVDVQAAADAAAAEGADAQPAGMPLSQAVFEGQQLMLEAYTQDLTPERPGVVDVYGLVFAPYAGEEVFRRESTMVSDLLQDRFDAEGRVLHLLNHAETADTHLWATPENLRSAVDALAATMDREQDVLVVYMTSHGARNHQLAAAHPPLQVDPMTPELLRHMLDDAGIRHRVIAISACYSGGWLDTLATPSTLIMTAADATHTSYGCGMRSELTFFGRAVFNEQLRSTYSFTEAFNKAVPIIAQREVEAGKADGFSNPQMRVGAEIDPVLKALAQRLSAEAATPSSAPRPGGKGLVAQTPMAHRAVQLR
ncbi:peptidase C13-like protein [Acidovorax sp. 62]|uniref:C13 family peptidase n=1 Tax=Acidovorax sp. 62 TaxID=2035203 RepID=UPI000C1844A2|nr:C13 family peptidase [Acidovorax sp. 62]PIF89697.1 peptidase C13-like protein [Acidovorax sp. 62]